MGLDNAPPLSDLVQNTANAQSTVVVSDTSGVTSSLPTGAVVPYAGSGAPSSGWLVCDGSAVSRTTYQTLFGVIGTAFGVGDGSTTFNLPDLQGRVPVGISGAGGHTDVTTRGNSDATALANRRPKHKHTVTDPTHTHGFSSNPWVDGGSGSPPNTYSAGAVNPSRLSATSAASTGISVGTSTDNADAPPYLVLSFIIKT